MKVTTNRHVEQVGKEWSVLSWHAQEKNYLHFEYGYRKCPGAGIPICIRKTSRILYLQIKF